MYLPFMPLHLLERTQSDFLSAMCRASVGSLTVKRHRGGNDEALNRMTFIGQYVEERGGPKDIDRRVMDDLIHRLPHANGGRLMRHVLHTLQGRPQDVAIADVAGDQLCLLIQVC